MWRYHAIIASVLFLFIVAAWADGVSVPLAIPQNKSGAAFSYPPVASAGGGVTFDPANTGTSAALSGGNLVLTSTQNGGSSYALSRSTTSHSTGKFAVGWTITGYNSAVCAGGFSQGLGIVNATASLNNYVGIDTNGFGYQPTLGYEVLNNSFTTNTGITWSQGDTQLMEIDLTAQLVWYQQNGGTWNNSGTANPETATGGISFSGIAAGPYFAAASTTCIPDVITVNFTPSAHTVSFGFW